MVVVAQFVRASDCGSEGRGFETHHPPFKASQIVGLFCFHILTEKFDYNNWVNIIDKVNCFRYLFRKT